jgi:putative FmdB family regulatory protein
MPIYAYRCDACGHAQDVLQKISDPVLTVCPACGAPSFQKQLTAAGFQLKGSGWYVTDFRDGNKGKGGKDDAKDSAKDEPKDGAKADVSSAEGKADSKAADAPATKTAAPATAAPAPAAAAKPAATPSPPPAAGG